MSGINHFFVIVTGQVESAQIPESGNAFCKYEYVFGPDWEVVKGSGGSVVLEEGISQVTTATGGPDSSFVFNFPVEISFRSTNPFGWPQMAFSVHSFGLTGASALPWCVFPPKKPSSPFDI